MREGVDDQVGQDIVDGGRLSDYLSDTVHICGYLDRHFNNGRFRLHSMGGFVPHVVLDPKALAPSYDHVTIRDTAIRIYDDASDLL